MLSAIVGVVLVKFVVGQSPLPPLPDLPLPPITAPGVGGQTLPVPKGNTSHETSPAQKALIPQNDGGRGQADASKPLPFRLIDSIPAPEPLSLKPAPMPLADVSLTPNLVSPGLVLTRSSPATIKANSPFAYELVVRNSGNSAVSKARLEEDLPTGTRFVGAQPPPVVLGDKLVWELEKVQPGAEHRFKVEVEVHRDGEWTATGVLSILVSSTAKIEVTGAAPQSLMIVGPGSIPVGHPAQFQIQISNTTGAPLNDALLRVQLGPGLQHVHGEAIEAPIGDLAPGQAKQLALELIGLQTGNLGGEVTLVSGKKVLTHARLTLAATEPQALMLRQTGPLAPPVGGEHEFKLEITNRSAAEISDIQLVDMLPEGLRFVAADSGAQFDTSTRAIRWTIGALAPGQIRQVSFRAQVRGPGAQVNRVSVRGLGVSETQLITFVRVAGESR